MAEWRNNMATAQQGEAKTRTNETIFNSRPNRHESHLSCAKDSVSSQATGKVAALTGGLMLGIALESNRNSSVNL